MSLRSRILFTSLMALTLPMRQTVANALLSGVRISDPVRFIQAKFGIATITMANNKLNMSATPTFDTEGDFGFDTSTHQLKYRDNSATRVVPNRAEVALVDGSQAFTGSINAGSNPILNLLNAVGAQDAVPLSQVQDLIAAVAGGLIPVNSMDYIGTRTITEINALTPTRGMTVVAGAAGTPTAGTSDLLAVGDVAEFDGVNWIKLISNSGGFVPSGVRLVVSANALFAPLTDASDEVKLALFGGSSNTPTLTTPDDGDVIKVRDQSTVENTYWSYDVDPGPSHWTQTAGPGMLHSLLAGRNTDDHDLYFAKDGRSGGQTASGGTATNNNLSLQGTSNGTPGTAKIIAISPLQVNANVTLNGDTDIIPATTNQGRVGTSANKFKEVHAGLIVQEDGVYVGNGKQFRLQETDYGFRLLDQTGTGAALDDRTTGRAYRMLRVPEQVGRFQGLALRALGIC